MANHTANWTHYSAYHVYSHLAIYFSSPFCRCPTFHTLASVERKSLQCALRMFSYFQAIYSFMSHVVLHVRTDNAVNSDPNTKDNHSIIINNM